MTRRAAIAKVQIARKELGLDDGTYRAMLERLTGRTSSADCSDAQLGLVLDEMRAKGWKPSFVAGGQKATPSRPAASRSRPADTPMAGKARALWISLHLLGVVRDGSETALEAFARRQLGVERLQWASPSRGYRLIEALKAMAERSGWPQDLTGVPPELQTITLKRRLFVAQEKRLKAVEPERLPEDGLAAALIETELDERIAKNGRHLIAHARRQAPE